MSSTENIYMPNQKSKRIKITSILLLAVIFVGSALGIWANFAINDTNSYFATKDTVTGEIKVKGAQIKVLQKTTGDYVDVTDDGFDLGVKYFVPDNEYDYDIIIKNNDSANVTADAYYLRWSFTAVIDGDEVDIGEYCDVATTLVHKQQDSDGRIRFYTISGSTSSALSAQQTTTMISKIKFTTKDSTNILDQYASGSKIKIICNIEGQLDPYVVTDVATPTYTRVDATGNYILFGYYPKTVATSVELASITSTNKTDSDGYYLDANGNRYKKFTALNCFTSSEQAIIQTTTVDNSLASTLDSSNSYVCEDTNDKVFLLSRKELTTEAYGFSTTASESDTERRKQTTDYAKANYAFTATSTYLGNGW